MVPHRIVLLHAGAAAASWRQSGRRIPVRRAARILRALRERLCRAASRRGYPGARGDGLPRRRDQSDAAATSSSASPMPMPGPKHCSAASGAASIPTGAVAPSRIERGLGGALPSSEFVPLLARLDEGWFKSLQLTWDAFNHDWRRHVIGFNYDKQRSLWRDWNMDRLPPAVITAIVAGLIGLWGAGMLGLISWWRRRSGDRARLLWDALCRRLVECRLAETAARRAARVRRTRLRALAGIRRRVSRHRGIVCDTPLWSAAGNAQHATAREAALARLTRAIEVLPGSPRALRASHARRCRSARGRYKAARRGRAPCRFNRARSFSIASAWIWRTRSRVTLSSPARSSSVATSRPLRP